MRAKAREKNIKKIEVRKCKDKQAEKKDGAKYKEGGEGEREAKTRRVREQGQREKYRKQDINHDKNTHSKTKAAPRNIALRSSKLCLLSGFVV